MIAECMTVAGILVQAEQNRAAVIDDLHDEEAATVVAAWDSNPPPVDRLLVVEEPSGHLRFFLFNDDCLVGIFETQIVKGGDG